MPPDQARVAFVDEYGDPNLEVQKAGTTTYFILTAILVEEKDLTDLRRSIDRVRAKFFGTGELRSRSVGSNDNKRLHVLSALGTLPWSFYSLALDKREISKNSGLIYKRPFRKFAVGNLYKRLFGYFPALKVTVDESGSSDFMAEFQSYIDRKFHPDLFTRADFRFISSREEVVVQLADFIGGTIGRLLDPKKRANSVRGFFELLHPHALAVEEWPPRLRMISDHPIPGLAKEDRTVRGRSLLRALQFLESVPESTDMDQSSQVEVLKYLLYHFNFISNRTFVSSGRLLEILKSVLPGGCSLHYLQARVIAKLRDAGVLIASGPRGYKIPRSVNDLIGFVEHGHSILSPMLARIEKARNELLISTENRLDILAGQRYEYLREFLDQRRFTRAEK